MDIQWIVEDGVSDEVIKQLADDLRVPPVFAHILFSRGIKNLADAKHFFRDGIECLHDPFLMADMELASQTVINAMQEGQKILIYGDYDVDGITSTSMLVLFFRQMGYEVEYHIPNRIKDGYGLNVSTIENIHAKGIELIITVDCGITAFEETRRAAELGMQVIVCDHHQPGAELPEAVAVLNPKRNDCPFPFKELAGVGVAFKLAQAIALRSEFDIDQLFRLLDLVAIGSAADIVPLVDENRIFTRAGLLALMQTDNTGLKALLKRTRLDNKNLGTGDIIFVLAPRMNAVGRMGEASRAVELLTTSDEEKAEAIVTVLENENLNRRVLDEGTFKEAQSMLDGSFNPEEDAVLVLESEKWHPGIIGIAASRIVEKYYRPTVMISNTDGKGKGSARSISGFSIYDAIESCSDLLLSFGGHKYAAGLSIKSENIPEFRKRINAFARSVLTEELLKKKLRISGGIRFADITEKFLLVLKMLAPFGPQNLKPVFCSSGVKVIGTPRIVGSNHLRFRAAQGGITFDAIGFNLGGKIDQIKKKAGPFDIAYLVEENEWKGRVSTQLRIRDIR